MEEEKSKIKNLFYCSKDLQCVLISTIQQSDSIIYRHTHTHTHTHSLFHIFSIMVYHRVLNIFPCVIQ